MRLIGGKWKGSILWHLKDGPVRFNELARTLGGASKKIINERLKEMEEIGYSKEMLSATDQSPLNTKLPSLENLLLIFLNNLKIGL